MSAPRLNRKLVLEAPARVADGAGGFSESWQALGTLWGEVKARSGTVRSQGGATVSRVSYRIVMRAAPQGSLMRPEPDQRLREGDRIYAIRAVADLGSDGRYLTCFADEEVSA
ncbi:MAG: phage head closure protein [Paracoccaceae bacterium]